MTAQLIPYLFNFIKRNRYNRMMKNCFNTFVLIWTFSLTDQAHAYQLEDLMAAKNFKHDQDLAQDLHSALKHFSPKSNFLASGGHRKPHELFHKQEFAKLWEQQIKNECFRLKSTYGHAMKESDFNDANFLDIYNDFRSRFEDHVFKSCDSFENSVTEYIEQLSGQRSLPFLIKRYKESLESATASFNVSMVKAFADQTSNRYTARMNERSAIQIHLTWLKAYKPNHPQLPTWEKQFKEINQNYIKAADKVADELLLKSKLPLDYFADDHADEITTGNALRTQIIALMKQQFSVPVQQVILRDGGLKPAKRFIDKEEHLTLQQYRAIPFVAVVAINKNEVSTHRGWYEITEDNNEKVVILQHDNNIDTTRTDQLVTTRIPKSALELRQERDAARINQKNKTIQNNGTVIRTEAVQQLNQDSTSFSAENQVNLEPKNKMNDELNLNSGLTNMLFRFITLLTAILMVIAGLLVNRTTISNRLPKNLRGPFNRLLSIIKPFVPILGLTLVGLGIFGVVINVLSIQVVGMALSLLAVAVGLLLGMDKLLNFYPITPASQQKTAIKNKMSLLKNYQMLIGFSSLVMGAMMLLGVL